MSYNYSYAGFCIFLLAFSLNSAVAKTLHSTTLLVDDIKFTPEFTTVREENDIVVAIKPANHLTNFPGKRITLEYNKKQPKGRSFFKPFTKLRDDGKSADLLADDGIYTAKIKITPASLDDIQFRLVAKQKHRKAKLVSDIFTLPVKNSCGPTGVILANTIVSPRDKNATTQSIEFFVPGSTVPPRETILRIINGAEVNSPLTNRAKRVRFTLNNTEIYRLKKSLNIVELPVVLQTGLNKLEISHFKGKADQKLALNITACADQITLAAISESLLIDSEPLSAIAKVTAQGIPVKSAGVTFSLTENLTSDSNKQALSQQNGYAQTSFTLTGAGTGELTATVNGANPELFASTPVQTINQPIIQLNQGFQNLTLAPGESEKIPFFLFYLAKDSIQRHQVFDYTIEPDNAGLAVIDDKSPATGEAVIRPVSFEYEPTLTAVSAGDYILTASARVLETGELIQTTTNIHVTEPGTPEPLLINQPGFTPAAILPASPTTVSVRVLLEGSSTPPDSLNLDEIDADGNLIAADITTLTDNGALGDSHAGDLIYSAQFEINRNSAQNLYFRISADYFGEKIVSAPSIFVISPFNITSPDADIDQLISDSSGDTQIFANEILIKFISNTTPDRIEQITASIEGTILSIIPELQLYRIEFPGDGSIHSIEQAIATVSGFAEVLSVSKNAEVTEAAPSCDWSNPAVNCPQDPNFINGSQWHHNKIRSKQAWEAALLVDSNNFAGSPSVPVAVIDLGVDCNNSELSTHGTEGITPCVKVDAETHTHGTEVAGVIAADANNQTGAGVAWNTKVLSFYGGNDSASIASAIIRAGNSDAKILNISMTSLLSPQYQTALVDNIRDAVCNVANKGKLIVAAVGQPTSADKTLYPAAFNMETTTECNAGVSLASHILAVGASNQSDGLATWNESGTTLSSNQVGWVDLYAPGVAITSLSNNLNNGTSFATPQVTGGAAMLWPLLPPGTNAVDIHDRLLNSAVDIGNISTLGEEKRLDLLNAIPQVTGGISNIVTLNFVTESADFRNMFGVYNRTSRSATILIENVDLNSNPDLANFNTELNLSTEELENLEYFLIPNGASIAVNQNYLQNTPEENRDLEVFSDAGGVFRIRDRVSGTVLLGSGAAAFFSENSLNSQNAVQVRNRTGDTDTNFHLDWEDQPFVVSDQDYNDAIFRITIQTQ